MCSNKTYASELEKKSGKCGSAVASYFAIRLPCGEMTCLEQNRVQD